MVLVFRHWFICNGQYELKIKIETLSAVHVFVLFVALYHCLYRPFLYINM